MSHDYGLYCKDHNTLDLFGDHFSYDGGAMLLKKALDHRDAFVAFMVACEKAADGGWGWPGNYADYRVVVASFLNRHNGCHVVVMDEYNVEWGLCGRFSEGPWGHTHDCTLPENHFPLLCNWGRSLAALESTR